MALSAGEIFVQVGADVAGFKRGMTSVDRELASANRRVGSSVGAFNNLEKSLASTALHAAKMVTAFAGIAGVVGFVGILGSAVKAAAEEEMSLSKLETQLKALGISWQANRDQIEKTIKAQSALSGFQDDELRGSFTSLVRTTGDVNKALALNSLALDIARAKHIDINTAAMVLGKVYAGNIGILARYGIAIEKGTSATEALSILHTKFAGQAEAFGKTATGAYERFHTQVNEAKEALGMSFLPMLTKVGNEAATFLSRPETRERIAHFGELLSEKVGNAARGLFSFFQEHRATIVAVFEAGRDAAQKFWNILDRLLSITDRVAQKLGGWKPLLEAIGSVWAVSKIMKLTSAFTGMMGVAGAGGLLGAEAAAGGLLMRLRKLAAIPAIIIGVELAMNPPGWAKRYSGAKGWGNLAKDMLKYSPLGVLLGIFGVGPAAPGPMGVSVPTGVGSGGLPGTHATHLPGGQTAAGTQIPTSFADTHGARGMTAFGPNRGPMTDIGFNRGGGVVILSPAENTVVWRLSGKSPSLGGRAGGAYGYSVYLASPTGTYFITHLAEVYVKPGQHLAPGTPIGITANAAVAHMAASASHAHVEKTEQVMMPVPISAESTAIPGGAETAPGKKKGGGTKPAITDIPADLRIAVTTAERIRGLPGLRQQLSIQRQVLALFTGRLAGAKPADRAALEEARTETLGNIDDLAAEIAKRVKTGVDKQDAAMQAAANKLARPFRSFHGQMIDHAAVNRTLEKLRTQAISKAHRIVEGLKTAIESKRNAFGSAFGALGDKALRVFDAKTQELLRKARASVTAFGFSIGVGEETPAEKRLREFQEKRQTDRTMAERADLEKQAADLSGTLARRADESDEDYKAREDSRIRDLAAVKDRLRESDLDSQEAALRTQAEAERKAADDALSTRQAEIEDERALEREHLRERLDAIGVLLATGKVSAAEARGMISALFTEFGIAVADSAALGLAFAQGYADALTLTLDAVAKLAQAQRDLNAAIRDEAAARSSISGLGKAAPIPGIPGRSGVGGRPEGLFGFVGGAARGAIVRARPGGSLMLVGEGGADEAIIPLSGSPGAIGGSVTVHVYGNVQTERELVDAVVEGIRRVGQRGGQVWTRTPAFKT